jgi:hypothetical protein
MMTHDPFDFTELEPLLFLSRHPQHANQVLQVGAQAVVNVCDWETPSYCDGLPASVRVVHWPFESKWRLPESWLTTAVLELAHFQQQGLRTLVHCARGRSRSPTVILLYWMARAELTWAAAHARLEALRWSDLRANRLPEMVDEPTAQRITARVRALFAGDTPSLLAWRNRAEQLRARFVGLREWEPTASTHRWKPLTAQLALTDQLADWAVWRTTSTDELLVIALQSSAPPDLPAEARLYLFPEGEPTDLALLRQAIAQLVAAWRLGRRVMFADRGRVGTRRVSTATIAHSGALRRRPQPQPHGGAALLDGPRRPHLAPGV